MRVGDGICEGVCVPGVCVYECLCANMNVCIYEFAQEFGERIRMFPAISINIDVVVVTVESMIPAL